MPSPLGHALAGFTIGCLAEPSDAPPRLLNRFTISAALFAALPDADLIYPPMHRTWSHSLGLTALIFIVVAAVTGKVTGRIAWRLALVMALGQASHILMDWMGADPYNPNGVQAFWPFDRRMYISGWDFFPGTERMLDTLKNVLTDIYALTFESVVMGPIALVGVLVRRRRRSRVPTSAPDGRRQPSV